MVATLNDARGTVSLGIVGCGAVAQQYYVRVLPLIERLRVTAVADSNVAAAQLVAQQLHARVVSVTEIAAMASTVIIATPPHTHYALTRLFLEQGVSVVCEKPFVGAGHEALDLVQLALTHNVRLYVGHFRRLYPSVQMVRDIVATGILGRLQQLSIVEGGRYSWPTRSSYIGRAPLSGVLYDTGSHAIDMALFASGLDRTDFDVNVRRVKRDRAEPADAVEAEVLLERGEVQLCCDVRLSRFDTLANRIRIVGENGSLEVSTRLKNDVLVKSDQGTTVLHVPTATIDPMQCIAEQFAIVVSGSDERQRMFSADAFVTLTRVLETIAAAE